MPAAPMDVSIASGTCTTPCMHVVVGLVVPTLVVGRYTVGVPVEPGKRRRFVSATYLATCAMPYLRCRS